MNITPETKKIITFLEQIGIETEFGEILEETFLPGIKIASGRLIIDPLRLKYPGDLLHEAGHIAVVPASERETLNGNIEPDSPSQSLEMGALLWSYAALRHLCLDPAVVFHESGYKGQSTWLIEQFEAGTYIGLPLIQWMGLAYDEQKAARMNVSAFPHMIKWTRE